MSKFDICPECGKKSFIMVQCNKNIQFWSCTNENCIEHAELYTNFEGEWVSVVNMMKKLKGVVDEKSTSNKSRV